MTELVLYGLLIIFILVVISGLRQVRPFEKGVIERFGKFRKVAHQGLHFIVPFVDKLYKVNLTEQMMDVKPQEVITKDNLNARVDLVVYYKIKTDDESVKKSIYNVDDFEGQIVSLAQTTARNVIGTMPFVTVNSERGDLNTDLAKALDKESDAWGVEIVRVEMKEITPPEDVQDIMNKVLKAENEKIANKDYATAREVEADGIRRATIKEAEGRAKAIELKADAEANAIKAVSQASEKYFKKRAERQKQLEVLETTMKDGTKWVLPADGGFLKLLDLAKIENQGKKK